MNWFANQRQAWIVEMLRIYGFINRRHLERKFGVSDAQAALDFKRFKNDYPGSMEYDAKRKAHIATDLFLALEC